MAFRTLSYSLSNNCSVVASLFCGCIFPVTLELFHPRRHPPNERPVVWWIVLVAEGCWLLPLRQSSIIGPAAGGRPARYRQRVRHVHSLSVDKLTFSSILRLTVCPSNVPRLSTRYLAGGPSPHCTLPCNHV